MTYALGYNTNGFAGHRLEDALRLLADTGYSAVAITLDHHHLDPLATDIPARTDRVAALLDELGLRRVVETGARYLLDPRDKHEPTLVSQAAEPRMELTRSAVRVAERLGAECVSLWSGTVPRDVPETVAWQRLRDRLPPLVEYAGARGMRLGFEPEPGMAVDTLPALFRLRAELGHPEALGITLDVGHCVAVEDRSAADCVRAAAPWLVNVQLDDMRAGVHEHLPFGEGELDLPATLAALDEVGYRGVAAVELPRHSHAAPVLAAASLRALNAAATAVV
ncbi:sugar phosphate isomerase/epimerase family protein [Sciscionella sediminilitoris]|uniref:sugar phosphate isomerase/epimerase family protein n=1 Tax=Sciscionella sediminilitoris TaxID=1445613 RepID=UPI000B21E516